MSKEKTRLKRTRTYCLKQFKTCMRCLIMTCNDMLTPIIRDACIQEKLGKSRATEE